MITFKVFFGCEIENLEDQIGLGHDGHFHETMEERNQAGDDVPTVPNDPDESGNR